MLANKVPPEVGVVGTFPATPLAEARAWPDLQDYEVALLDTAVDDLSIGDRLIRASLLGD